MQGRQAARRRGLAAEWTLRQETQAGHVPRSHELFAAIIATVIGEYNYSSAYVFGRFFLSRGNSNDGNASFCFGGLHNIIARKYKIIIIILTKYQELVILANICFLSFLLSGLQGFERKIYQAINVALNQPPVVLLPLSSRGSVGIGYLSVVVCLCYFRCRCCMLEQHESKRAPSRGAEAFNRCTR